MSPTTKTFDYVRATMPETGVQGESALSASQQAQPASDAASDSEKPGKQRRQEDQQTEDRQTP